jgi:hypothetical protein
MELEYDKQLNILSLNFYKEVQYLACYFDDYNEKSLKDKFLYFITEYKNVLVRRIKAACRILFLGRIGMQEEFLLKDSVHINDFIEALKEAKEFCEKDEKENLR